MVKHMRTVCSFAGILSLAAGFWLILPAYGMIAVGIWCIVVSEIGVLGKGKRSRDAA